MKLQDRSPRETAQSLPAALADVTLIDARTSAATGGMGVSWWLARVAAGEAPKPAIQRPRMTRWRLVDVRNFWAAQAVDSSAPASSSNTNKG
ncbi:hypothetical protein [Inhella gelatinilytica]|uniref:Uncharacterized protein n=1 Tax=Inhella gelatinilytica TaxID=2795030 RepID=A0A931IX21_9BURK|nr:hypothetical protein [Inhella gelatinilytica]MBH9553136.1 hypothetical protein [Inhella gelatinilytica]